MKDDEETTLPNQLCDRCPAMDRRLLHLEDWAWGPHHDNGITARIRRLERDLKALQRTMWAASGAVVLFNSLALPLLIGLVMKWLG